MDGPDFVDVDGIEVPEVQLPRQLTAEELARLPNRDVSISEALEVYSSTVEQLHYLFPE